MADESGGNAENTRYEQIVDVPAYTPPTVEEPKVEPVETPSEESEQPNDDEAQPKKRNGYKEKLERERQRAAELEAQLAEARKLKEEPKPSTEGKPKPEDFESWEAYYEKLADWKIDQRDKERETKSKDERLKNEFADKQKQYAAKADEFKAAQPDFDEVIESYEGPLTPHMQQALLDSEMGPQIAYYVAQHPEEGEALAQMGVLALNKAIGRIEAKLESGIKPALKVTQAPPPIKPVGKSSTNSTYNPYSAGGKDDHDEYMRWRKNQK